MSGPEKWADDLMASATDLQKCQAGMRDKNKGKANENHLKYPKIT